MKAVSHLRFLKKLRKKYIFVLLVSTYLFSIYWNKWKKTEYSVGLELREKLSTLQSIFPLEVQSIHNLRLNVHLSNEIGIFREPVDTRHDSCKSLKYDTSDMPTVSVVIPFYNEIWSVLLRTVTGILLRSPPYLIRKKYFGWWRQYIWIFGRTTWLFSQTDTKDTSDSSLKSPGSDSNTHDRCKGCLRGCPHFPGFSFRS